jgi:hypothetical protein
MKTKVTMFIVMVCLLAVGAFAQIGASTIQMQPKQEAINIDGLTGEVSMMTTTGVPAQPVMLSNVGKYLGCQGAKRWAWDNAIDLNKDGLDYRLNLLPLHSVCLPAVAAHSLPHCCHCALSAP